VGHVSTAALTLNYIAGNMDVHKPN
jgi:hypothetical protein